MRLERITEEVELDTESLTYLYEHRFIPGSSATVVGREPDGSLRLDARGSTLTLGAGLCSQLYVSPGVQEVSGDASSLPTETPPTEIVV